MMKKELIGILCLAFSLGLSAQDDQAPLHIDIHAGTTAAYLQNSHAGQTANTGLKAGFTMGAGLEIRLSKWLALQPEMNFENIGGGKDDHLLETMPLQGYDKYRFEYFTIPILLKLRLPVTGLDIYAGPQYGKRLSAKLDYGQGLTEDADGLHKKDLAGVFGAEYYLTVTKGFAVGLSGRYQLGFYNIYENPINDYTLRTRAFLLTAGCRF